MQSSTKAPTAPTATAQCIYDALLCSLGTPAFPLITLLAPAGVNYVDVKSLKLRDDGPTIVFPIPQAPKMPPKQAPAPAPPAPAPASASAAPAPEPEPEPEFPPFPSMTFRQFEASRRKMLPRWQRRREFYTTHVARTRGRIQQPPSASVRGK